MGTPCTQVTDYELVEFRAAAQLQAVWRGHLSRALAVRLRWEKQSKLKRIVQFRTPTRSFIENAGPRQSQATTEAH